MRLILNYRMRVTVYNTSEFAAKTTTEWTYNNIKQRSKCMLYLGSGMIEPAEGVSISKRYICFRSLFQRDLKILIH